VGVGEEMSEGVSEISLERSKLSRRRKGHWDHQKGEVRFGVQCKRRSIVSRMEKKGHVEEKIGGTHAASQ